MRGHGLKKRAALISGSIVLTFILLRSYLYLFPSSNFNFGAYNIHHLFTGLLFITIAGLPLALFSGNSRLLDIASIFFGAGLSMALDEWLYLIITDGSDSAYLLPISLWGAVVMIGLVLIYILLLFLFGRRQTDNDY